MLTFPGLGQRALFLITFALAAQVLSAAFLARELLANAFDWQVNTIPAGMRGPIEVLCSIALLAGVLGSIALFVIASKYILRANTQLDAAAGEFQLHMERQFDDWSLTPSERAVALLVIKGFSNEEIAKLRGTTQSTVKSQVTSIFRKAKLTSRMQLVVSVIEDVVTAIPEDEPRNS